MADDEQLVVEPARTASGFGVGSRGRALLRSLPKLNEACCDLGVVVREDPLDEFFKLLGIPEVIGTASRGSHLDYLVNRLLLPTNLTERSHEERAGSAKVLPLVARREGLFQVFLGFREMLHPEGLIRCQETQHVICVPLVVIIVIRIFWILGSHRFHLV